MFAEERGFSQATASRTTPSMQVCFLRIVETVSFQVVCEAVKVNRRNRHGLGVKIGVSGTGGGEFTVPDAAELRAADNLLDQHGKLPVTGFQGRLHLIQQ